MMICGTRVQDGNYRLYPSIAGHSQTATVNLSLLHLHRRARERPSFARTKELRQGPRAIQADSQVTVNFKATERALGSLPCALNSRLRLGIVTRNGSKRDNILGAQRHRPLEPAFTPPAA